MAHRLHAPINHLRHHRHRQQNHRNNLNNLQNNDDDELIDDDDDEEDETNQLYQNNHSNRTTTNDDNNPSSSKEKKHLYLTNCKSYYVCIHCRSHLADHDDLVSRAFTGSHGRAHLFDKVVNINYDEPVLRSLITGQHLVSDIYCSRCETRIGWRYEKAHVDSQKYKEGKFVIELYHVVRENRHLELDESDRFFGQKLNEYDFSLSRDNHNFCSQTNNFSDMLRSNSYPKQFTATVGTTSSPMIANEDEINAMLSRDNPGRTNSLQTSNQDRNTTRKPSLSFGEDLLFTFYDDWCSIKSSYPPNLSANHFNRKRRSVYLESKPYDWKQPHETHDEGQHFNASKMDDTVNLGSRDSHITPSTSAASSSGVSSGLSIVSPSSSCSDTSANIPQRFDETIPTTSSRRHKPRTVSLCQDLGSNNDDSSIDGDEIQFELETDPSTWQDNDNISKSKDEFSKLNTGLVMVDDEEYYDCCEPLEFSNLQS